MLTLTPQLRKKVGAEAKRMFGDRQGALSMWVEMTLRNHLGMSQPGVDEN